jgi:predicted urease superfamily metal-dependent hydrolase
MTQAKTEAPPNVYQCIAAVQAALAKTGISKSRRNQQQGYDFRGIDEVYDALAPLLAQNGLCILPRIVGREVTERHTKNGGALFNVVVEAEFDFIAAGDGSKHTVRTYGEAMDSADKATNKAMSAAYKYAALMAFAIPTEGDNDADATTHEVVAAMPDAEWTKLVQLIEASGADRGAMIKHFGIDSLRNLNQGQYAEAIEMLEKKLAKAAKAQTQELAKELADEIQF